MYEYSSTSKCALFGVMYFSKDQFGFGLAVHRVPVLSLSHPMPPLPVPWRSSNKKRLFGETENVSPPRGNSAKTPPASSPPASSATAPSAGAPVAAAAGPAGTGTCGIGTETHDSESGMLAPEAVSMTLLVI